MKVILISHTPNPEHVVASAASQCYNAGFAGDTFDCVSPKADARIIANVIGMGHTSVLEHASFNFAIEGISRACSHQLVRFRVASFSQQSQRYCFLGEDFEYVTPSSIAGNIPMEQAYGSFMQAAGELYAELVAQGVPAEDARFVLPNACCTNIYLTMNARELWHMFNLRCCIHAQWEIRELANRMLVMVKQVAPILFDKAGPNCARGFCTEGKRSCNPQLVRT